MPESSVGGVFEIVSWIDGLATLASARNVVSRFTNSCACVLATGATIRAARSSAGKRSRSLVRESARFAATGWRLPVSYWYRACPCSTSDWCPAVVSVRSGSPAGVDR